MLLIRPKTIDDVALVSSSIAETPPPAWLGGSTYGAGDLVVSATSAVVANHTNTTVASLGGGTYTVQKTSGADATYNASAVSALGFAGDFVLRLKHLVSGITPNAWFAGMNSDPLTDDNYASIDYAFISNEGSGLWGIYENGGSITANIAATSIYAWLWRIGTTLYYGHGATLAAAQAVPDRAVSGVTATLYFDSSLYSTNDKFEVQLSGTTTVSAAAVTYYRSLQGTNIGNDPASSPTYWLAAGAVYPVYNAAFLYALGDQVAGPPMRFGPEVVTNGTFTSGTAGWTKSVNAASIASVGGALRVTGSASAYGDANQALTLVPGQRYYWNFTLKARTVSDIFQIAPDGFAPVVQVQGATIGAVTSGLFVATQTNYTINAGIDGTTGTVDYDDISVRKAADSDHRIYESLSGGTSAAVTMTIASPCVVSWTAHGLAANAPITFTTTGALPTGLIAGTVYYVLAPTTNSFNVSATAGGAAINTSGSQSGTHTAIANPNLNKAITDPAFWLDIGPSNKWALFDAKVGTATSDASQIDATARPVGLADAVALVGLANAASARIVVTDAIDGVVYDQSFSLTSTLGITSWHAWFFEEIKRKALLLITGLPPYFSPSIRLIITGGGGANVGCGLALFGQIKELGETDRDGAEIGITDYSRVTIDDFGDYSITPRDYAKRGNFHSYIARADIDGIEKILGDLRATPTVFSATDAYESMQIFALVKNFSIVPIDGDEAQLTLELQGLT